MITLYPVIETACACLFSLSSQTSLASSSASVTSRPSSALSQQAMMTSSAAATSATRKRKNLGSSAAGASAGAAVTSSLDAPPSLTSSSGGVRRALTSSHAKTLDVPGRRPLCVKYICERNCGLRVTEAAAPPLPSLARASCVVAGCCQICTWP